MDIRFIKYIVPSFVVILAWSALLLSEIGEFNSYYCLILALAGSGIFSYWIRRYDADQKHGKLATSVCVIAFAVSTLLWTTPPDEMILGGWDPGVYVHTSAEISKGGSLQIDAPDVAAMSSQEEQLLCRKIFGVAEPFGGMRLRPNGRLSPQFLHLFPSLMAVMYSFFGVWGSLIVNPLLNILSIILIYHLASRLFGPRYGVAAAILLALNPAQIWQAKFPTAELLTQFLLLCGTNLLVKIKNDSENAFLGIPAGLCFGIALLAKYEIILFLVPIVLLSLYNAIINDNRKTYYALVAGILLGCIHLWVHMQYVAPYYRPLFGIVKPLLLITLVAASVLFVFSRITRMRAIVSSLARFDIYLRVLVISFFMVFVFFAWYIRPRLTMEGDVFAVANTFFNVIGIENWLAYLGGADAWNMKSLESIFGSLGLLFGVAGIVGMIWFIKRRSERIWLFSSLFVTVFLIFNIFHDHFMMWMTRRFIPVAIPFLVIGIVAFLKFAADGFSRFREYYGATVFSLVLALVLILNLQNTYAMMSMRNWPGLIGWYERLDEVIPEEAFIYTDQPGFAAPLRFLHDKKSYLVRISLDKENERTPFRDLLTRKKEEGYPVYLLTSMERSAFPKMNLTVRGHNDLESHIIQHGRYKVPKTRKRRQGRFVLYEFLGKKSGDD